MKVLIFIMIAGILAAAFGVLLILADCFLSTDKIGDAGAFLLLVGSMMFGGAYTLTFVVSATKALPHILRLLE